MDYLVRFTAVVSLGALLMLGAPVSADYEGSDGYGSSDGYGFEVPHDGYRQEVVVTQEGGDATYVVIEAEDGTTEQMDGETIIVVEEPAPVAATEHAPPAPKTVVVVQPEVRCSEGIWVEGHWAYGNGDYVWVDGHCVVERVDYVFVQPRWDFYASVWWFVPGYYRPCGVFVGFGYHRPRHWFPPYHHPYYRTRHPVPVHRTVPRRPTVARPTRGVVGRPIPGTGRAPAVRRNPATYGRTGTVGRAGAQPSRVGTVARSPNGRTGTVSRTQPSRVGTVTRSPNGRTGTVSRTRPSNTRVDSVSRRGVNPSRTTVVHRPPTSTVSRTRAVGRTGSGPTLTSAAPRSRPSNSMVSQPRVNPSRASSVRRPASMGNSRYSISRPSSSRSSATPARTTSVRRPSFGSSGSRSSVSRPSTGSRPSMGSRPSFSRPSMGSRPGGFSRPSGGFGGSRSVPTARSR